MLTGMLRDYVQKLRDDRRSAAIDIYTHINPKLLKESYLALSLELRIDCQLLFGWTVTTGVKTLWGDEDHQGRTVRRME